MVTEDDFDNHLWCIKEVLMCLWEKGVKVNIGKSTFIEVSIKYIEYQLNHHSISPLIKLVDAFLSIDPPKNLGTLYISNTNEIYGKSKEKILCPLLI